MQKFCCLMFVFLMSFSLYADKIEIASDPWLPYTGDAKEGKKGFMIEVATEALKDAGHEVVYINRPWTRAVADARKGKINAIAGAYKEDAPDFVFPKEPIGLAGNTVYALKESSLVYENLDSIKGKKLGVIADYSYGEIIDNYIKSMKGDKKAVQTSVGENALMLLFKKMEKKRIDFFIEDASVVADFVKKNPKLDVVKRVGDVSEPEGVFIAFSPKNPKSKGYAKALSEGIEKMRKNGRLAKILESYGLKDWK